MVIDKQTKEFIACVAENLPFHLDQHQMQQWIDNPRGLRSLLSRLCLSIEGSPLEQPLDFTVRVNRFEKPVYPEWVDKPMHQDLECKGPAEYDLSRGIEQWLHPDQSKKVVVGNIIYETIKRDNALAVQLGLTDLRIIQKIGVTVFRALFKGNIFGWKSVVRGRDKDGSLYVPYLYESVGGEVVLRWNWLGNNWNFNSLALRFCN